MIRVDHTFSKYQTGGFTDHSFKKVKWIQSKKLIIYKNLISHIVQINFEAGLEPIQDFKNLRHNDCVVWNHQARVIADHRFEWIRWRQPKQSQSKRIFCL